MGIQEEMKRSYQVEIEEIRRHVYIVDDCSSEEEALAAAEEWLGDGEEGAIISQEITEGDAYPISKEDTN